jgi:hypothetical protein
VGFVNFLDSMAFQELQENLAKRGVVPQRVLAVLGANPVQGGEHANELVEARGGLTGSHDVDHRPEAPRWNPQFLSRLMPLDGAQSLDCRIGELLSEVVRELDQLLIPGVRSHG